MGIYYSILLCLTFPKLKRKLRCDRRSQYPTQETARESKKTTQETDFRSPITLPHAPPPPSSLQAAGLSQLLRWPETSSLMCTPSSGHQRGSQCRAHTGWGPTGGVPKPSAHWGGPTGGGSRC